MLTGFSTLSNRYLPVVHAKLAEQCAHAVRDHPMVALGSGFEAQVLWHQQAAIEAAERGHGRSLELRLAEQRLAHGQQHQELAARQINKPLSFANMSAIAAKQKACVISFSKVRSDEIQIGVLGSADGALKGLITQKLASDGHTQSLRKVVESLRKAIGVRGRSRGHSSASRRRKAQRRRQAHAARGPLPWGDSSSDDVNWLTPSQSLQKDRAAADAEAKAAADAEAKKAAAEEKAAAKKKADEAARAADEKRGLGECYDLFIKPIEHLLKDESRLLIIPDGDLFTVPFDALLDSNNKFLCQNFVVSLSPSLGTLVQLLERRKERAEAAFPPPKPSALIVGDPNYYTWQTELTRDDTTKTIIVAGATGEESRGYNGREVVVREYDCSRREYLVEFTDTGKKGRVKNENLFVLGGRAINTTTHNEVTIVAYEAIEGADYF